MSIDWQSADSHILMNPTYSGEEQKRYQAILQEASQWAAHIWLATSGSSAQKWVGLSKEAILSSAHAVNQHLKSDHRDRWVNALPFFHVGGLGIFARAHLTGAEIFDFRHAFPGKWNAEYYYAFIDEVQGTLSALVPAQLYDLVSLKRKAPSTLRALIIGGGALPPELYQQARSLGWPVLPSYGLTECASQVATATLESLEKSEYPSLSLLSHIQGCEREGRLCFAGSSLLTTYAFLEDDKIEFIDPKKQKWLMSEDRGYIHHRHVIILGRADSVIKVGGENIDMDRLENHFQNLRLQMSVDVEATLIALPDERLGHIVCCVSNDRNLQAMTPFIAQFQMSVLPFERIRQFYFIGELPRSPLGKILKKELLEAVKK